MYFELSRLIHLLSSQSTIVTPLMVSVIGSAWSMRFLFDQLHELHQIVQIGSIEVAQLLVAVLVVHVALDV